ncbi:prothoracicotropic hormone-like isoform X1 [Hylaeus volcanicus]|uniref:prothoracicotropic hormone-like isoform X1 n=1 Tax=Hylaeus volcanicus TaxID=313075 RepID=UPI0023B86CDF|nr:prothoracicotropic hormone-like isoform X1 [Hylaeus volcanicus]
MSGDNIAPFVVQVMLYALEVAELMLASSEWSLQTLNIDTQPESYDKSWNDEDLLIERPSFHNNRINVRTRSSCSCETEFGHKKYLGYGFYPKYLSESACKRRTCQDKFHRCKLLSYSVYVLQQRQAYGARYSYDNALQEPELPECLRQDWQPKKVEVAVACVPDTGSRQN